MSGKNIRALHYVFKIGDRKATAAFYKDILGMRALRHEEFEAGCEATCNGPYDGKWSKTMIGYGPEDSHFVCELTYNYGISEYKRGNSFIGLHVKDDGILERAGATAEGGWVTAPDGYRVCVEGGAVEAGKDPVQKVVLASSDLQATAQYWSGVLGLTQVEGGPKDSVTFSCAPDQALLQFNKVDGAVQHGKAGGRVAFSCPAAALPDVEAAARAAGGRVLTPLLSLDTPGKATVQVVILADPDGHEICFVGDEAFRSLSQVDPEAERLLQEAVEADGSDAWFAKKGRKKEVEE